MNDLARSMSTGGERDGQCEKYAVFKIEVLVLMMASPQRYQESPEGISEDASVVMGNSSLNVADGRLQGGGRNQRSEPRLTMERCCLPERFSFEV